MNRQYPAWFAAAVVLSAALSPQSTVAEVGRPGSTVSPPGSQLIRTAQLPRYTASGRHQCGSGNDPKRAPVARGSPAAMHIRRGREK